MFIESSNRTNLANVVFREANISLPGMISHCPDVHQAFHIVHKVAPTKSTVLVLGESGTGKELVARAIHQLSARSGKLVPVNCGAIPEEILESELFGHEKGAFTGAINSKIGRFQLADGGTIFLDEIGEMSPKLQVKLLRVLQERRIEPVGSIKSIEVDVRVIAATNKNLLEEVKAGRFREDLYYRLQVVPIELPPLRHRAGDTVWLARYFMQRACQVIGKICKKFSKEALTALSNHNWPGNVRELENLMERLAVLVDHEEILISDLPSYICDANNTTPLTMPPTVEFPSGGVNFNSLIDVYETTLINTALMRTNGNKRAAAKLLGLNRTTLVEKIKKKGLESDKCSSESAQRYDFLSDNDGSEEEID